MVIKEHTMVNAPSTHDFEVVDSRTLYEGAILALRKDRVRMPGGTIATREVVEHSGAVAIVALNEEMKVLLEYQYRHPTGRRLWEIPAGILDIPGEKPLTAVQRELCEETSYAAEEWHVIADTVTSPGFADESVRIFLARGIYSVDRPSPEEEEADMRLQWMPLSQAVQHIYSGEIVNNIAIAGILGAAYALATNSVGMLRSTDADWDTKAWRFAQRKGWQK